MKKVLGFVACVLLPAVPALAQEVPQQAPPTYNCDYEPACEVSPGIYGAMASSAMSKFKLSVGGYVKLDYVYNSTNLGANGALGTLQQIPKSSSPAAKQDQSIFTARQSRLWFKVAGPNFLGAKSTALIETDFYGGGGSSNETASLRMRLAYGSLDWANTQVLFGQAYDIFGPAVSSTIDFGSGAKTGAPNNPRVPQIRLTQKVNLSADNALRLMVGVQNPVQDSNLQNGTGADTWGSTPNVAGQAMLVSKALGVAPGYWGLPMNSLTAGFFGLYGKENVGGNNGHKENTYGYGFYTFVPVLKSKDGKNRAMTASFEGQIYQAANMAYNGATAAALVGPAGNKTPAKGFGYWGQLMFYPTQALGITGGYGAREVDKKSGYAGIANYEKSNSNLYANVQYDLNAAVRVAAEYQHLVTKYGNSASVAGTNLAGTASRGTDEVARLSVMYFF